MTWHVKTSMKRTSAGSAQLACYISVHSVPVPLSALRRMVLQNVKHVAWLAYQLELKETQQHRDNEVNHVSVVGRLRLWATCQPVAYRQSPPAISVSHSLPVQFPGAPSSVERTMTRAAKTRVKNRKRNPGP